MEIDPRFPALQANGFSASGTLRTADEPEQAAAEPAPDGSGNPIGEFYVSPVLRFDAPSSTVIFQIRDAESGDVTRQFPPETVVEQYRRDPSSRPFVGTPPAEEEEPEVRINGREVREGEEIDLPGGPDTDADPGEGETRSVTPNASEGTAAAGLSAPSPAPQLAPTQPVDVLA